MFELAQRAMVTGEKWKDDVNTAFDQGYRQGSASMREVKATLGNTEQLMKEFGTARENLKPPADAAVETRQLDASVSNLSRGAKDQLAETKIF